jgi:hypothetical protein
MSKHTPGPWQIRSVKGDPLLQVCADKEPVAIVAHPWPTTIGDPARIQSANARLIASAPELLAACERQVANIERWLETGVPADAAESKSIYDQMKAAIAKAEGSDAAA